MTLSRSLLAAALACALLPSAASAAESIEKVMGNITAHAGTCLLYTSRCV